MTLDELMQLASDAYPDDLVMESHLVKGNVGDTLAWCIASNIYGTFEPDEKDHVQLATALATLRRVSDDLQVVIDTLQEHADIWEMEE